MMSSDWPAVSYQQALAAYEAGQKLHLEGRVYLVRQVLRPPEDGLVLWVTDERTRGDHGLLLFPDGRTEGPEMPSPSDCCPEAVRVRSLLRCPACGTMFLSGEGAMPKQIVILITTGSREEAVRIANALVAEMMAACVNIIPGVTSVYRWQGEVQRAEEWLLMVKSRGEVLDDIIRRVKELHSYDVPEIIALPLAGGSDSYLRWIDDEVQGDWHAVD